ncbi:hypothetical protein RHMOL_Rhmol07G0284600 [Rhododendron molle]|uniref:Uncharacterized protein n=1 Tax=Rhododendron molle TaxID=49168 RepID=A0ACC0N6Z2_RHOML|nr:hypothetical protein RHMOL_Rhmol07G0284600 [Rhododendron molle]
MVAASDRLSARRGRGAALFFNGCPYAAKTPRTSGSLLFGVASIPAKGNHFVFFLAVSPSLWLLDYCIGEDRFHCAALISTIRVLFLEGNCLSGFILHVSRPCL